MLLTLCRNLVNEIDTLASPEGFSFKLSLLELYVDERNVQQQLRSSQLLRSSIGTYLGRLDPSSAQSCSNRSVAEADYRRTLNPLLESIDPIALGKLETSFANSSDHTQTLIYVLAILRHFPLKILYTATGWQTDKEQMASSTRTLRDQFERIVPRRAVACGTLPTSLNTHGTLDTLHVTTCSVFASQLATYGRLASSIRQRF